VIAAIYEGGQLGQRQNLPGSTRNQKDMTMKKTIMLAGFAALLASSALAQALAGVYGSGNIIFPNDPAAAAAAGAYGTIVPGVAGGAFAHEPSRSRAYDGPRHYYDRPYKYHRHSGHHQYRHWSEF